MSDEVHLKPVKTRPFFLKWNFLLLFSLLMIMGAVLTWWMVLRKDRAMREELLQQTEIVAQGLNIERIMGLTGAPADTLRPDYHRLKRQLTALMHLNEKYHFIYLMAPADDGSIIFLIDNEPVGSPDEVTPGMVYREAPAGFHRAMETGISGIEGPYQDRWGTFISGYIPLTDPLTDEVLALLAVDYEADVWKQSLVSAAIAPLLLTVLLAALMIIASYLFSLRSRILPQTFVSLQNLEPVTVALVGLILSLFFGWVAHLDELSTIHDAFIQLASGQTAGVAEKLYEIRDIKLESLARFYEGSDSVTPEEFSWFSQYLTKNPDIYSWAWAEYVSARDVSRFIAEIRSSGHEDFQIWELDPTWNRGPAVGRDVYYPVMQIVPFLNSEPLFGFDIASRPDRYASLQDAASTGLITVTNLIELVRDGEKKNVLLIYRPVFRPEGPEQIQGFAIAAIRVENFIKNAVHDPSAMIEFSLLHPNAEQELLATSGKNVNPVMNLKFTRPVLAYGKTFSITAYAGERFMRLHPQHYGWMTSLAGIFITIALTVTTSVLIRYHRRLQELVLIRTAELRTSEERHRLLFENALAAITTCEIIVDEAGNPIDYVYLSVNPAYEKYTGLRREDVVGRRFTQVLKGIDGQTLIEKFGNVVRTGESTSFEYYIEQDDQYFYINAYPLNEKQFATVFSDVTRSKKAEKEKASLEIQLLQAQKMEAIGRLAGGVAHDFNNMLCVIIGNTELILDSLDPSSPLRSDLKEIRNAAEHSADLTQQLLAYARKQTVIPEVLDLNATTAGMLNMLRQLIGENIELVWLPGHDLWTVAIDPSQVDQILVNLCVNARDAIDSTGIVTIRTGNITFDEDSVANHSDVAAGDYVMIVVSDDGKGMDEDTLENIFEPFYTTKEVGEGTGLGLSTVYGIVQQNKGNIIAESEPGRGTTFSIYLPRVARNDQDNAPDGQKGVLAAGHETILLAEDEPAILKMTKSILERQGYTVLAASSPDAVIRLADEYDNDIHLLITDVVMPGMNGRELALSLNASRPGLKKLFMSGYTADVIANHGVVDEGVNFIQKPFTLEEITTKIRLMLDTT